MEKAKVYFTKEVSPDALVKMYEVLGVELPGKVAVKLHSGEQGNKNYLRPEFVEKLVQRVNGTVVECNTAYPGARDTTEKHQKLMDEHGWSKYFDVDIMDSVQYRCNCGYNQAAFAEKYRQTNQVYVDSNVCCCGGIYDDGTGRNRKMDLC